MGKAALSAAAGSLELFLRGETMNRQNRSKLFFRAFFTILAVLALVVIGAFCTYMLWEKAPDISGEAPAQVSAQPVKSDSGSDDTGTAFNTDRQDGVYTVLLVGNDDGNGNTDTIIVGKIDTVQHKMDFVSIPRDTLVNISWNIRKINAVYWGTVNSGGVGIDGLRQQVKNLLGRGLLRGHRPQRVHRHGRRPRRHILRRPLRHGL